jgi:hypothetical protein
MPPKIIKTVLATKNDFVLLTEDNRMFVNPTFEAVQEVLDSLDTGFGNSFAILSRGENYVQTLHGLNGFHLELRETMESSFVHYRVGRISDSSELVEPSELQKSDDMTSQGFSNELLELQDVISAFSDFLHSQPRSDAYLWREVDLESDTLEA